MEFGMQKAECLRLHIWHRIRQYLDQNHCLRHDIDYVAGEQRRCDWIITDIRFTEHHVEVDYLDPAIARDVYNGPMKGSAVHLQYDDELFALRDVADAHIKLCTSPVPDGTPIFETPA